MQGVTAALVGFVFVCIIFPHLVKHHTQFYASVALVLLVVLLDVLTSVWFFHALSGVLQVIAIILFILACGGLSARELAGELGKVYEGLRRGEGEKTVIIPLTGQPGAKASKAQAEEDTIVFEAAAGDAAQGTPPSPSPKPNEDSSLPLA